MARTGILYSDVMKAAQIVAADGRNPTVDSVREALGSTGSKSTIAPLLKRGKEVFQGAGAVKTESGLPAELMEAMSATITPEDERRLLAHLTRLAAEVEQSVTRTAYRFGAAAAYYRLVQQRVDDLREERLAGFPPIREFMERRLAPAMATCQSVAARQSDLSTRIARRSALLRTRVDIELERQNQELLVQMNRRAKLQLRLQETVEGLSVVAITYYGSQLVQYLAKGLQKSFVPALSPEIAAAVSIPLIAGIVALGIRRMRKVLAAEDGAGH